LPFLLILFIEDNYALKMDDKEYSQKLEGFLKEVSNIRNKNMETFEKQLSYITSGALGLSMLIAQSLFKEVATTEYKGILIGAWVLFVLTLVLNLWSNLQAAASQYKTMEEIAETGKLDLEKYDVGNRRIETFNYICVAGLVLGISGVVLYISLNLLL
jgi:hypothetical protein